MPAAGDRALLAGQCPSLRACLEEVPDPRCRFGHNEIMRRGYAVWQVSQSAAALLLTVVFAPLIMVAGEPLRRYVLARPAARPSRPGWGRPQGLIPPGWPVLCADERPRSLPRARQNVAERAVRAGPSPVTTRQPLTWTVTGGNGRPPAANANRSEPWNCAGQFTGPRGIAGSPHSSVARARTGRGSRMVVPRGRSMAGSSSWRAMVRLTATLVRFGMSLHRATPAGSLPSATGAVPGPLAGAERPAATWLPQAASVTMAPTAIAPSGRTRRTIILTPR